VDYESQRRFTAAVHTLLCIHFFEGAERVTSEFISGSTGVNAVIIRKVLLQLQKAGLVETAPG
jgi:Predicted transcriptional regulator